jgi:hypothetical protein
MKVSLARNLLTEVSTEPVVAWRTWALTGRSEGDNLLLRPVAGRSRPWKPRSAVEAACKHAKLHAAPNVDCTCGLYGTRKVEPLRHTRSPAVIGRVALWGRVIEHELGYRAEFAYPQRLRLVCRFCFWQWGLLGSDPSVVGWFPRDELIPLCWAHVELATRYGLEPHRIIPAEEIEQQLRDVYAVDLLHI